MGLFDDMQIRRNGAAVNRQYPKIDAYRAGLRAAFFFDCLFANTDLYWHFRMGDDLEHILCRDSKCPKDWNEVAHRFALQDGEGAGLLIWVYKKGNPGRGILIQPWIRPINAQCLDSYPRMNIPTGETKKTIIQLLNRLNIYQLTVLMDKGGDWEAKIPLNPMQFWFCRYSDIPEDNWMDHDKHSKGVVDMIKCDSRNCAQWKPVSKSCKKLLQAINSAIENKGGNTVWIDKNY